MPRDAYLARSRGESEGCFTSDDTQMEKKSRPKLTASIRRSPYVSVPIE